MAIKILLTSTSFQDTPGKHQALLNSYGFELDRLRGPIKEEVLLGVIDKYDGVICGDDEYTAKVIAKGAASKLKVISKYGVGFDSIDVEFAKKNGVQVTNCPGINHTSVAEHVFALLLCFAKNIHLEHQYTSKGEWKRLTGFELSGKTIGVIGLGAVGREVAKKANQWGIDVYGFDVNPDADYCKTNNVKICKTINDIFSNADIVSLHLPLNKNTEGVIDKKAIASMKDGVIIVNTSRGKLISNEAVIEGIKSNKIRGYLCDVLDEEPMPVGHPLQNFQNVLITPHIASRTFESVERQGTMAVENLVNALNR